MKIRVFQSKNTPILLQIIRRAKFLKIIRATLNIGVFSEQKKKNGDNARTENHRRQEVVIDGDVDRKKKQNNTILHRTRDRTIIM